MLRKGSSDFAVFLQFINEVHFTSILQLLQKNNIKIQTFIDAGSNIGLAILFFKIYFPEVSVIAIEPEKENINQIKRHMAMNQHDNIYFETNSPLE